MRVEETGSPTIPIAVEFGGSLEPLRSTLDEDEVRRRMILEVGRAARRLGVPGWPAVRLRSGNSHRAIRVRVHGALQPYPPIRLTEAWTCAAREAGLSDQAAEAWLEGTLQAAESPPNEGGFPDNWVAEAIGAAQGDLEGRSFLTWFVSRLCLDIISERPACLLGPEQVRAYAHFPPNTLASSPNLEDLSTVLESLLSLGVSIVEKERVLGELAVGRASSHSVDNKVESCFSRLRRRSVEIRLAPENLASWTWARGTGGGGDSMETGDVEAEEPLLEMERLLAGERAMVLPRFDWNLDPTLPRDVAVVRINDADGPWRAVGDPSELVRVLGEELAVNAHRLLGEEDVEYLLAVLQQEYGAHALVRAVLEKRSLTDLTRLLRVYLREGQLIRDLPGLLDRVLRFDVIRTDPDRYEVFDERLPALPRRGPGASTSRDLVEFVRRASKGAVAWAAARGASQLALLVADPEVEKRAMATAGFLPKNSSVAPLDESEQEALRDSIWDLVGPGGPLAQGVAISTSTSARAAVQKLIMDELPELPVLAPAELGEGLPTQAVGLLSVRHDAPLSTTDPEPS